MIAPALDQIADEFEGKITIAKMDVDSSPQTPNQYGVRGIPTLMIFRDGNIQAMKVGGIPKGALQSFVEENI
jgi:thioredoxin 1